MAIEEVGREFHGDGDFGEFFEGASDSHARVEAGSAGNEDQPSAAADGADILLETAKSDGFVGDIQTTTHGIDDRLGLLEDLLLHEVVELSLHDFLEFQLEGLDGADVRGSVILGETVDIEGAIVDVGDIVVFEVQDFLRVLDNSGWVGGEEELGWNGHAVVGEESSGLRAVEEGFVWGREKACGCFLHRQSLRCSLGWEWSFLGVFDVHKVDLHLLLCAHTNDERRALASGDTLLWIVDRFHQ